MCLVILFRILLSVFLTHKSTQGLTDRQSRSAKGQYGRWTDDQTNSLHMMIPDCRRYFSGCRSVPISFFGGLSFSPPFLFHFDFQFQQLPTQLPTVFNHNAGRVLSLWPQWIDDRYNTISLCQQLPDINCRRPAYALLWIWIWRCRCPTNPAIFILATVLIQYLARRGSEECLDGGEVVSPRLFQFQDSLSLVLPPPLTMTGALLLPRLRLFLMLLAWIGMRKSWQLLTSMNISVVAMTR